MKFDARVREIKPLLPKNALGSFHQCMWVDGLASWKILLQSRFIKVSNVNILPWKKCLKFCTMLFLLSHLYFQKYKFSNDHINAIKSMLIFAVLIFHRVERGVITMSKIHKTS